MHSPKALGKHLCLFQWLQAFLGLWPHHHSTVCSVFQLVKGWLAILSACRWSLGSTCLLLLSEL